MDSAPPAAPPKPATTAKNTAPTTIMAETNTSAIDINLNNTDIAIITITIIINLITKYQVSGELKREFHTAQQEYQSSPEYQTVQPEYQSVQPEYQPPLRRADSRAFVPGPQPRPQTPPLNFQPQGYARPPAPNQQGYRPNPPPQQQFRPQLPPQQEYQRAYPPENGPQLSPLSPHPPQILRPNNPQGQALRRSNPWALLKQKLPADVRQQFVPANRAQFDARRMQSPDQQNVQRPPGDGQPGNPNQPGMGRGGPNQSPSPNPGMQSPQGMQQGGPPNPMYNGRPPSGNQPKMMQRPMSQEGRESPSSNPGMPRIMSGERRPQFEMQRSDSMQRPMMSPPGMYPPRPMGGGRETPPGPPRTPKPDDDDDVMYSPIGEPRMGMGRGQTPPPMMRPPSGPRPFPPDLNRDLNSQRPLSRTESRQSFEIRSPNPVDIKGDPKMMPREGPMSRPMSSELAKTPFQFRPEGQNTPPASPKPPIDGQNQRPYLSPQESLDRQRSSPMPGSPKPPDYRPPSRAPDESGKLTPSSGAESRNLSPQPSFDLREMPVVTEKPPSGLSGSASPMRSEPSRSATPNSLPRDAQSADSLNPKSPASQSITPTPTPTKSNDSGNATPLIVSGSNTREGTPVKTPIRSGTPDSGRTEVERPVSLRGSPSLKDLAAPDGEGRTTPQGRPASGASAGRENDAVSPLQRIPSGKRSKTPKTPEGDHDSGVDETTQRKQDGPTTNGDLGSPLKSPSKIPAPKKLLTGPPSPTKGSKASPKTPDAPSTGEKKKVPMNKIQVGAAPSPNLKEIKSKIGSLQNSTHKPGGGHVKIEHRKLDWKAQPRIAAKNDTYQPGGGDKKIQQTKLQWNAKSKIGSLENTTHKPGGGEKKIESVKLDFKDKAKPKVGSKDNMKHNPGGGNVKTSIPEGSQNGNSGDIEDQKLDIKAQSKIDSMGNVKHRPGGGDKKIFDDKDYLRQMSGTTSKAGSEGAPSGTQGDGWSSARSSRRASRERRRSGDRRYRSESRLGLRTPDPDLSRDASEMDLNSNQTGGGIREEEEEKVVEEDEGKRNGKTGSLKEIQAKVGVEKASKVVEEDDGKRNGKTGSLKEIQTNGGVEKVSKVVEEDEGKRNGKTGSLKEIQAKVGLEKASKVVEEDEGKRNGMVEAHEAVLSESAKEHKMLADGIKSEIKETGDGISRLIGHGEKLVGECKEGVALNEDTLGKNVAKTKLESKVIDHIENAYEKVLPEDSLTMNNTDPKGVTVGEGKGVVESNTIEHITEVYGGNVKNSKGETQPCDIVKQEQVKERAHVESLTKPNENDKGKEENAPNAMGNTSSSITNLINESLQEDKIPRGSIQDENKTGAGKDENKIIKQERSTADELNHLINNNTSTKVTEFSLPKIESKEDTVKEIKEVDCKEALIKESTLVKPSDVSCKTNTELNSKGAESSSNRKESSS